MLMLTHYSVWVYVSTLTHFQTQTEYTKCHPGQECLCLFSSDAFSNNEIRKKNGFMSCTYTRETLTSQSYCRWVFLLLLLLDLIMLCNRNLLHLTRKLRTDASCLATSSFQLTDTDLPLFK